ncbi:MAG: HD domain-containing protein [Clostridia bacterium]|nr:HD domain-containing protein [Clostridia bacterium]
MNERFTNMRDLNASLAEALNLIDPNIENHHQQTAYMAYMIGREAGFSERELALTRMAALVHDIGFITSDEPKSIEELESEDFDVSEISARLVEGFPDAKAVANIVRYCQKSWSYYLTLDEKIKEECLQSARIANTVHLADAVSAMVRGDAPVLNQVKDIREAVLRARGTEFSEEVADAFLRASENEYVWMDLRYNPQFLNFFVGEISPVSLDRAVEMTVIMSRVIDFRSSFTAMHSAGVAAAAGALARFAGLSPDECKMMTVAGHMHDIGKLKVPRAILEKPGRLTEEEFNVVKEHPYYTRLIMMNVEGFEKISWWAGLHHEKLNGKGYPFRLGASELDTGARIMAVADIFSAITEVRPYRKGMNRKEAFAVLSENVRSGGIDGDIVALLGERYEEIDRLREAAARSEGERYYNSIGGAAV